MPSSWPLEALKAQAVAARGYAVRAAHTSWYDIYDDTRDQVYGGLDYGSGEDPGSTAAVKATAGEVLKSGGEVISAYFSSSNGGRTAASADTLGRFALVPHLEDRIPSTGTGRTRTATGPWCSRRVALQNRLGASS